ncbi:MAG TPA: hypothetical protein VGG61_14815, partial [Gemmataceae bacterium]
KSPTGIVVAASFQLAGSIHEQVKNLLPPTFCGATRMRQAVRAPIVPAKRTNVGTKSFFCLLSLSVSLTDRYAGNSAWFF